VAAFGLTVLLPLQATLPTPLSIVHVVAFVVLQARVEASGLPTVSPLSGKMLVGLAVNALMVGPSAGVGVGNGFGADGPMGVEQCRWLTVAATTIAPRITAQERDAGRMTPP
jgi:hypothetical protein